MLHGKQRKKMTMTPSPLSLDKQHHQQGIQHQSSGGASKTMQHTEDKENSNITAALEGIRAMKEVLSRNNMTTTVEAGDDDYNKAAQDTQQVMSTPKVLNTIENVMAGMSSSPSHNQQQQMDLNVNVEKASSPLPSILNSGGRASSTTSTFTFEDSAGSKRRSVSPQDLVGEPIKIRESSQPQSEISSVPSTPPQPRDVSMMLQEAMAMSPNNPNIVTPSKQSIGSPTEMLAHSLWIKEKQQRFVESPLKTKTAGGEAEEGKKGLKEKLKMLGSFVAAVALVTLFKRIGSSSSSNRNNNNRGEGQTSYPTTYIAKEMRG